MLGSGACVALFGAAYFWQIHSMTYFIVVQIVGGERAQWECTKLVWWALPSVALSNAIARS